MIYQVRANLFFDEEDEAKDFYHDCELALPKGTLINPDQPNLEFSAIELIDNNHDQDPNQPCIIRAFENNFPEH